MSKEVAVKESSAVSIVNATAAVRSNALSSDRKLPLLLLMQGQSEFVLGRKASIGDMVRSSNMEKVGDPDNPVEVIILSEPVSSWRMEEKVGEKWKFRGVEPRTAMNERHPWNFGKMPDGRQVAKDTPGSTPWRRIHTINCFVLLPKDILAMEEEKAKAARGEMPDLNKALMPLAVSFRSTSVDAGKAFVELYDRGRAFNLDGSNYIVKLGCVMDSNDNGIFYNFVADCSKAKPVPAEMKEAVALWRDTVRSSTVLVDEEPEESTPSAPKNAGDVC